MSDVGGGTHDFGRGATGAGAADAWRVVRGGRALLVEVPGVTPLRLTGADRVDFLHGQISSDVRGLAIGETNEGLLLNHKGHALAQLRVVRRADDVYVAVEGGAGDLVRDHLARHIIFDQVEVRDLSGEIVVWTLQGAAGGVDTALDAVGAVRPAPGMSHQVPWEDASVLVTAARRSGAGGVDLHVLARQADGIRRALEGAGAVLADRTALRLLRTVAGIPHAATEGGDGVLPQEAGLEPLVSYRKGCYLGQEIMARIEARGSVRRALHGVLLEDEPRGADVEREGRSVGRLGSIARHPELGWVGLAVLRVDLEGDAAVSFGGVGGRRAPLPLEAAVE